MPLFQLLKAWHKDPSIRNYDVRDLIVELQEWMDEGFLEADIWSTLEKRLNPALLPEQMKQETDASLPQVNEPRIKQKIIEKHSDCMKYFLNSLITNFLSKKSKTSFQVEHLNTLFHVLQAGKRSTAMGTETRTKSQAHEQINRLLLHEVAKYVYYDTLGIFASELGVEHARITTSNMFYVNEQIYQVGDTRNKSISLNEDSKAKYHLTNDILKNIIQ